MGADKLAMIALLTVATMVLLPLIMTAVGPLVAALVRALLRPLVGTHMDSVDLKEAEYFREKCKHHAAGLRVRKRNHAAKVKDATWEVRDEILLECYQSLALDLDQLVELLEHEQRGTPPSSAS